MQSTYPAALKEILRWEGGYAERPNEPGGAVMEGVSLETYAEYRRGKGLSRPTFNDLHRITNEEVSDIYRTMYANHVRFDDLPAGLDYCVLDAAVNEGVTGSLRFLATAIDMPITDLRANAAFPEFDIGVAIDFICDARLIKKQARPEWSRFGKGWTNRIESVRRVSKEMVVPTQE